MTPHERHNRLAPEIFALLTADGAGEADVMVVLESVILGVMLRFRPDPRHAGEYLDSMTTAVLERMSPR